jgi:hypothetical protein
MVVRGYVADDLDVAVARMPTLMGARRAWPSSTI